MDLDQNLQLSFFSLLELMTKIGYIESFDDCEKQLLNIFWNNLNKEQPDNNE